MLDEQKVAYIDMIHSVEIIVGYEDCDSSSENKKEGGSSLAESESDWKNQRVLVKVVEDLLALFQERYLR